jgi:hypothetical protein
MGDDDDLAATAKLQRSPALASTAAQETLLLTASISSLSISSSSPGFS